MLPWKMHDNAHGKIELFKEQWNLEVAKMQDECTCVSCAKECDPANCAAWRDGAECCRPVPAAVRARDEMGPPLPQMVAQRRAQLDTPARRRIVAFTGLAGSGKSTAALHLVKEHGYVRKRFAGPLKAMLAVLGLGEAEIDGDRKELPCKLLCGRTPRYAMQTLGGEWGRDLIGPDFWIRAWCASVDSTPAGVPIVVDDCRYPNEVEAILALGGVIARIDRTGAGSTSGARHASESHVLPHTMVIPNDRPLPEFLADVAYLAR
jgi:hypothetical protein